MLPPYVPRRRPNLSHLMQKKYQVTRRRNADGRPRRRGRSATPGRRVAKLRGDRTVLRRLRQQEKVGGLIPPYLGADSGVAFFSRGGRSPGSRSSSSQCGVRPEGGAAEQASVRPSVRAEMQPVCFLQPSHTPQFMSENIGAYTTRLAARRGPNETRN